MKPQTLLIVTATAWLAASSQAADSAQGGASPLDAVPVQMPFDVPYGPPISLQTAQVAINAARAEAARRGWRMNIAVVDSGAQLVAFVRMDGAQLASISISQHKAMTAVKFRRPTKYFEDAVQKSGLNYVMTLDGVVASRGGIPLIERGRIIGAIGCSGGAGSQDEAVCSAGAAAVGGK